MQLNDNTQENHTIYGLLAALVFLILAASSPAVTRLAATSSLTVADIIFLRCAGGLILFLPYLYKYRKRFTKSVFISGMLIAFCQGWGTHLFSVVGLKYAPAAHVSMLGSGFAAVWVALWGYLFFKRPASLRQMVGILFLVLGAFVLLYNSFQFLDKNTVFVGDFFFLCASALSGFYLVYVDQKKIDPLLASSLVAVISGVVVFGFYSVFPQESNLRKIPTRELAFHIFYQSLLIGGLIVLCLTFAASYLGSQKTSFFVAAIPVAALFCGKWIAGDPIHHFEIFAMIIVTCGILIGSRTTGSN